MAENTHPGKRQNGKCTTQKMAENTHPGTIQKIHTWKMHNLEIGRLKNAQPGKWQKIRTPEKGRKYTPGKWQNGKCMTQKMAENTHPGNRQKIQTWKMHNLDNARP